MGRVGITEAGASRWTRRGPIGTSGMDAQGYVEVDQDDEGVRAKRTFHPAPDDDQDGLEAFEVRLEPDGVIEPHAHEEAEIIYVLSGQLRLGARALGPGSSVHIPARTLYGLQAGAEGLHFLNFRAHPDRSFITKQDLVAAWARPDGSA
jgi:quercetin dioxygenase-like cupin family protein